jgi:hypothetical protein
VKLWQCKPSPAPDDPVLVEAEQRVADVEDRAHRVLVARKLWARDPWAVAVLHAIRGPKG